MILFWDVKRSLYVGKYPTYFEMVPVYPYKDPYLCMCPPMKLRPELFDETTKSSKNLGSDWQASGCPVQVCFS